MEKKKNLFEDIGTQSRQPDSRARDPGGRGQLQGALLDAFSHWGICQFTAPDGESAGRAAYKSLKGRADKSLRVAQPGAEVPVQREPQGGRATLRAPFPLGSSSVQSFPDKGQGEEKPRGTQLLRGLKAKQGFWQSCSPGESKMEFRAR